MRAFIKGSQKYRQDIFLILNNRLAIFEVLEIVAENYDKSTFIQNNNQNMNSSFKFRGKNLANF